LPPLRGFVAGTVRPPDAIPLLHAHIADRSHPDAGSIGEVRVESSQGAFGLLATTLRPRMIMRTVCRASVRASAMIVARSESEADILCNYPGLAHDDLAACLAYAGDVLRSEKVYPNAA